MANTWTVPFATPRHVGTIDERYSSYNVEMVEVIGGRFWRPYRSVDAARAARAKEAAHADETVTASGASGSAQPGGTVAATPEGMPADLYEQRPPLDLGQARLRTLAAALGPAYCRVSGTWSNDVYFHDADTPPPPGPPPGFGGVLTRDQVHGVVEFCAAVDAPLVTSFTVSDGVRDSAGTWQPDQARALLGAIGEMGGHVAAAEFMNEPTFAAMGHAPEGYDAAWFGRDVAAFRRLVDEVTPDLVVLGPGSVGEGGRTPVLPPGFDSMGSEALLATTPGAFATFSYHFYGAISERVAILLPKLGTSFDVALSEEWLTRTDQVHDFYAELRDRHLPGAAIWLTETAQAAGGADRWAATFVDTFRYLYQHGSLARRGVQAVFHNTLCASDYGLIDETTLSPRPNYWAALLWRRLIGTDVYDAGPAPAPDVHAFVHSARSGPGYTALVLNASASPVAIDVSAPARRFTLTADALDATVVALNGEPLAMVGDELPALDGEPVAVGEIELPARSVTFLTTG